MSIRCISWSRPHGPRSGSCESCAATRSWTGISCFLTRSWHRSAQAHYTFSDIIGSSAPLRNALTLARRGGRLNCAVLLQGETGTGKELFAQAIHNGGHRELGPFVPVNCGAIPAELLESELFGYASGAFSGAARGGRPGKFEHADGGTILLDEIGDMPMPMQVKLLRVLQTGEVCRVGSNQSVHFSTRVIASTNVDLTQAISDGSFRQDLYYRLHVFPIQIPSLRKRGAEDILQLARHFLAKLTPTPPVLSRDAEDALTAYHWPGNIRELENTLYRAMAMADSDILTADMLHLTSPMPSPKKTVGLQSLKHIEREAVITTVRNVPSLAEAAKILGISRTTLYRRLQEYDDSQ